MMRGQVPGTRVVRMLGMPTIGLLDIDMRPEDAEVEILPNTGGVVDGPEIGEDIGGVEVGLV